MNKINIADLKIAGGYFLNKKTPNSPSFKFDNSVPEEISHIFSYIGNKKSTIKEKAIEMINQAQKKIFIASFRIGEEDLIKALLNAVDRLNGGVYVVTMLDDRSLKQSIRDAGYGDEMGDESVDKQAQEKHFGELTKRGIFVRGHENCHAKFIVVDDEIALVSSANLETKALQNRLKKNIPITGENGVIIRKKKEVDRLARFFARLWRKSEWNLPPIPQTASVEQRNPGEITWEVPKASMGKAPAVIWTYPNEFLIQDAIRDLILSAENEVIIATYSLCDMSSNPEHLIDPIKRVIDDRKVKVKLVARVRNNHRPHCDDLKLLTKLGVKVFGDKGNHAKGVIVDEKRGALFSANFVPKQGLVGGVETGVRLDGTEALMAAKQFFEHTINNSGTDFVVDPTHQEIQTLVAGWMEKWNLSHKLKIEVAQKKEFEEEISRNQPVLFSQTEKSEGYTLHIGEKHFLLKPSQNKETYFLSEIKLSPDYPSSTSNINSKELLKHWISYKGAWGKRGSKANMMKRGIFPGVFEVVN